MQWNQVGRKSVYRMSRRTTFNKRALNSLIVHHCADVEPALYFPSYILLPLQEISHYAPASFLASNHICPSIQPHIYALTLDRREERYNHLFERKS